MSEKTAMKINKRFSQLTFSEYLFYLQNAHKYTDFNSLGIYRSLLENETLSLTEKLTIRDCAHQKFAKSFDFLQLKDPRAFIGVSTLGQTLTKADENQLWENIRDGQRRILTEKRLGHRNFGTYARHNCGLENCPLNGVMFRQSFESENGSINYYSGSHFHRYALQSKAKRLDRE